MDEMEQVLQRIGRQIYDRSYRQEVLAEVRDHLAEAAERLIERGMSPEAARQQAVWDFGNPVAVGRRFQWSRRGVRGLFGRVGGAAAVLMGVSILVSVLNSQRLWWRPVSGVVVTTLTTVLLLMYLLVLLGTYARLPGRRWQRLGLVAPLLVGTMLTGSSIGIMNLFYSPGHLSGVPVQGALLGLAVTLGLAGIWTTMLGNLVLGISMARRRMVWCIVPFWQVLAQWPLMNAPVFAVWIMLPAIIGWIAFGISLWVGWRVPERVQQTPTSA